MTVVDANHVRQTLVAISLRILAMECSVRPQKPLLAILSGWRSIVLAALSFGLLIFAILSTNFAQTFVPNPLAHANWIPQLSPNASISNQLYVLFFPGASSALDCSPPAEMRSRPTADSSFPVSNAIRQPCFDRRSSDRQGRGVPAGSSGERVSDQPDKSSKKENVPSATLEAFHRNPIDPHEEKVYPAPAKGIKNGSLPVDTRFNRSSAPVELVRGNDSYSKNNVSREEDFSPEAGRPTGAVKPSSTDVDSNDGPKLRNQSYWDRENDRLSSSPFKHSIGHCDISLGRWVEDNSLPLYQPGSCPFVDKSFSCQENGRPDSNYIRWKWVPRDCKVPRFNGTMMLERLRGKRFVFVGDSLNRNQWESMLCILRESLADKNRVSEIHGGLISKYPGSYIFKFLDYNCTLEFYTSHFLVYEEEEEYRAKFAIWLDRMDKSEREWREADVLVFNTGHWWTVDKISQGDIFREGAMVHHELDLMVAYQKAIQTWATWIDKYISAASARVFFRGYSPGHYRGGQWNSGGQCHFETQPIFNESFIDVPYPSKMQVVEEIISHMRVPVHILNITRLSEFRKDAHPAIYGHRPEEIKDYQDCSHWCLPGLPDTWNELLSFSLFTDA